MRRILNIALALAALTLSHPAHTRAQADTVYALLARTSTDIYAAVAETNSEGCLKTTIASRQFFEDSAIVMTKGHMRWRVRQTDGGFTLSTDSATFISVSGNDGKVNMVNLFAEKSAATLTMTDGLITTSHNGKTLWLALRKYRLKNKTVYDFCFTAKPPGADSNTFKPYLQAMPTDGEATFTPRGGAVLKGHVNAAQISKLIDNAPTYLDLTASVMPLDLLDFPATESGNRIIYVRENSLRLVPPSWRNVVSVGDNGARLATISELTDDNPLFIPHPFTAGRDSLSYTRLFPGQGWNTLVLPFTASHISRPISVYTPSGTDNDIIALDTCERITANTPCLMRIDENGAGNIAVTFVAEGNTTVSTDTLSDISPTFFGTFQTLMPETEGECLILGPDGYTFYPAALGSYLSPFRCAFMSRSAGSPKLLRLPKSSLTGITPVRKAAGQQKIYDISGTEITDIHSAPNGIYIINGKKQYIKRK